MACPGDGQQPCRRSTVDPAGSRPHARPERGSHGPALVATVIEFRDHRALAAWWALTLAWEAIIETDHEVVLVPPWARELAPTLRFEQVPPGLVFVPVEHGKHGKNRLHLDLAPHVSDDRDARIALGRVERGLGLARLPDPGRKQGRAVVARPASGKRQTARQRGHALGALE